VKNYTNGEKMTSYEQEIAREKHGFDCKISRCKNSDEQLKNKRK